MYLYKSTTGNPVNIDSYIVTVNPGLESKYQIEALDSLIGVSIQRYTDNILDPRDTSVPAMLDGPLI